jgi:glycerol-3-phosphate O-acyltransferase
MNAAELLRSPSFQEGVADLSERMGRGRDEITREALEAVAEMAARHAAAPMRAWSRVGRWLMKAYELQIDERAFARLRELDRDHTLVWLPSHRSYLDTWALPQALDRFGFPHYYVMGGANLDFWPFGDLARRTGLVFIRRSVRDDPVYRFALREYLRHLVRRGSDFGWSIEGGRTRTGKLRPPRYGLLRYLADAVRAEGAEKVLLVPVSIVYDQLPEVATMAAESRGAAKRPEDIRWLIEFARRQRAAGGRVYIDVAEPIPLADRLAQLEPDGHEVERVALEVCHRINRVTPVTAAAAVTIALLAADRALTLDEVVDAVAPLVGYVERRGLPVAGGRRLDDRELIAAALDQLAHTGAAIRFDQGCETVWGIGPEQHLVAAFYRNSAVHFLVGRAIAELAQQLVAEREPDDPEETGWQEALRLRELLKFEFFFPRKRDFLEDMREELAILSEPLMAHLVLRPFLEAYLVVAERLEARNPAEPVDEEEFVRECLGVGRQWTLQRRLGSAESVSAELFRTALRLVRHRGLEGPGDEALRERRAEFAEEIRETVARVAEVARRAARGSEVVVQSV